MKEFRPSTGVIINIGCFLFVTIFVILFSLYQALPWSNYRIKGFVKFILNPANIIYAAKAILPQQASADTTDLFLMKDRILWQGIEMPTQFADLSTGIPLSPVYVSSNGRWAAYMPNPHEVVTQKIGSQPVIYSLSGYQSIHIIHWIQGKDDLVIAGRAGDTWSIISLAQSSVKPIIQQIPYPEQDLLTAAISPIEESVIYPECTDRGCYFKALSIHDGKTSDYMEAVPDDDPAGCLKDIRMQFYDEKTGIVGYERLNDRRSEVFIVAKPPGELLQTIQLSINNKTQLHYLGYFHNKEYLLFDSLNLSSQSKDLFLYAANKPSLRILKPVDKDLAVSIMDQSGIYRVGKDTLRSAFDSGFTFSLKDIEVIPSL